MDTAPPRRRFLRQAGILLLSGTATQGCNVLLDPDVRAVGDSLIGMLERQDLAARLGRRYIRGQGVDVSRDGLTRQILGRLDLDINSMLFLSVDDLRYRLQSAVRGDFAGEAVTSVDGWLLSNTECRLCAIAYLSQSG